MMSRLHLTPASTLFVWLSLLQHADGQPLSPGNIEGPQETYERLRGGYEAGVVKHQVLWKASRAWLRNECAASRERCLAAWEEHIRIVTLMQASIGEGGAQGSTTEAEWRAWQQQIAWLEHYLENATRYIERANRKFVINSDPRPLNGHFSEQLRKGRCGCSGSPAPRIYRHCR